MWRQFLIVAAGMIIGCSQERRFQSVEDVCALANYRDCTLIETIGDAKAPFRHSSCMVLNKGVSKSVWYQQNGARVKRDLSKYKAQEIWLVGLSDDHDDSLVLVMTADRR